jgi:hypothetical protein
MATERDKFWMAVIIGFLVMLAFALITVNLLKFIPLLGPFIGGLVAGLIVRRNLIEGGKAGLVAGIIGGVVVSIDYLLGTAILQGILEPFAAFAGVLLVFIVVIYFAILGWIGGAIGAMIRK